MVIPRFQSVQFYGQGVNVPSISLPAPKAATPYSDMPLAGDKLVFEPLRVTFIIDEKMSNYEELRTWLMSIGFATSYEDFVNYKQRGPAKIQTLGEQDITITILDSKNNPICDFVFHDAIPTGLSGPELLTTNNDMNYLYSTVTFDYTYPEFVRNPA
jgi:hypothetical protein